MSLLSKKAVVLLLAAATSLGALNAYAAKATAKDTATAQKVSLLDGKFTFTLPKGFVASPLPTSPTGASGTMYSNETTKTVVIAAENSLPEGSRSRTTTASFSTAPQPTSTPRNARPCRITTNSAKKA
jgi:hypothetical protein